MDIGDGALGRATISGAADRAGYGTVARSLHWLVVALAVIIVSLGWTIEWTPLNTPIRSDILQVHCSIGVVILVLMMFRAMWRLRHPPPPLPASVGRAQAGLAHLTHLGLYLIFIVMPVSGLLNAAAAGHAIGFFGLFEIPTPRPANERLSQWAIAVHLVGQYVVYLLVALHVTGALYHALIRRDGVLERMLPRYRSALFRRA
jgi:cytochrome b561